MAGGGEEASLEHISAVELYPRREPVHDDPTIVPPYPDICGENLHYLGRTSDGVIALSNFRLFIRFKDSFVNMPLGMIEAIECRDIFFLHIYCKDARSVRCTFPNNDVCQQWFRRLSDAVNLPSKMQDVFAFRFWAYCRDLANQGQGEGEMDASCLLCMPGDADVYSFGREVERMQFDLKKAWRLCYVNENYKVSPTYPLTHVVPAAVSDSDIENVANFRSSRRFPSICWRDQQSGAVIARCSQPEVGWLGWRNTFDENLLQAISDACALNDAKEHVANGELPNGSTANGIDGIQSTEESGAKKMLIVDARSYAAAVANRAKGGGCECPEYYPNCEIQFMSLANIHSIRKSFQAVRTLCASVGDQTAWLSGLEATKWLHHLGGLMRAALVVVNAIDKEKRPVVVHCSDGWDRTPQLVALAELMLDPFYRTIEGFQVLVGREWLDYGHKFADRCGNGVCSEDINERCPVFLQFLDCAHQLLKQFPCAFEFNEAFLVKLAYHTYSNLFGTFLGNNPRERGNENIAKQTSSVWSLLKSGNKKFRNYLFTPNGQQVLRPSCQMRHIYLWAAVYLSNTPVSACMDYALDGVPSISSEEGSEDGGSKETQTLLPKTRSCDDIVAALEHTSNVANPRRLSDPNIGSDPNYLLMSTDSMGSKDEDDKMRQIEIKKDLVRFNKQAHSDNDLVNGNPGEETPAILVNGHLGPAEEGMNGEVEGEEAGAVLAGKEAEPCLQNGHVSDCDNNSEDCETVSSDTATPSGSSGAIDQQPAISVHSSTDTLTGIDAGIGDAVSPRDGRLSKSPGSPATLVSCSPEIDPQGTPKVTRHEVDTLANMSSRTLHASSSISTSTSDISDSHVNLAALNQFAQMKSNWNYESLLNLQASSSVLANNGKGIPVLEPLICNPSSGSKTSNSSAESGLSTPLHSQTPSSTSPPTPGTENKASCPWLSRPGISRYLDCDGLTVWADPAQQRLAQMETEYQRRIRQLEHQICLQRLALAQYAAAGSNGKCVTDNKDEILSLPESTGSGEHTSTGAGSTAASDVSWEQVEEKDALMTLWVPDHVVTHCASCDQEFWIVRRKHHCRNCGKVFCNECTSFQCPVPTQQLPTPVRVCRTCYSSLRGDLLVSVLESNNGSLGGGGGVADLPSFTNLTVAD